MAKLTDKFTLIRSLVGRRAQHNGINVMTGYNQRNAKGIHFGGPSMGSTVARLLADQQAGVLPFVSSLGGEANGDRGGFLGPAYNRMRLTKPTLRGVRPLEQTDGQCEKLRHDPTNGHAPQSKHPL